MEQQVNALEIAVLILFAALFRQPQVEIWQWQAFNQSSLTYQILLLEESRCKQMCLQKSETFVSESTKVLFI